MTSPKLHNYLRANRKRTGLTQKEVAFLLGSKSSAHISRHERFKQTPDLDTVLAYELLFRSPVRNVFSGAHQKAEKKFLHRVRLLIRKLMSVPKGGKQERKIALLSLYLEERSPLPGG